MNLSINLGGTNMNVQIGDQNNMPVSEMLVVPQPRQNKDYGVDNQNLFPSDDSNKNSLLKNVTVTIGTLGTFTYGQPKLLPKVEDPLPPPPVPMNTKNSMDFFTVLNHQECKDALIKHAKSICCGTSKPAYEGTITRIESYNSFRYKLETFNETRSLTLAYSPCSPGQKIDRLPGGQYPHPWSIPSQPSSNFKDETKLINFPHTDILQPCFRCGSYGDLKCGGCRLGKTKCNSCGGDGKKTIINNPDPPREEICTKCNGQGVTVCIRCSGDGRVRCNVCNGVQILRWFLQVKVQYINHIDEFLQERTELPDEILKEVAGEMLVQLEGVQLSPIVDSDNPDVNSNSARLIQKSLQVYNQEKRVLQRHQLLCIACTCCYMNYKNENYKYWILGQGRTVYSPNYPGNCCCTII